MPLSGAFLLALLLPLAAAAQNQFQWDPTWPVNGGQDAPDYGGGEVIGVALDAERVYMCHPTRNPVLVFDRAGRYLFSWGNGQLRLPHSIRVAPDGNVWVVEKITHQVFKYTRNGALLASFGTFRKRGRDATHFDMPTDVAFGADGTTYISDGYGNSRIVRLAADGRYLGEWGRHGSGAGQFRIPHSVAVDPSGRVYVADLNNRRIQVFTAGGQYITHWALTDRPFGLFIPPDGRVFIAYESGMVQVRDANGSLLGQVGERQKNYLKRKQWNPGELGKPHMLTVDEQGAFFTAELCGRIQRFRPQ
jgi:DNA-binding beta-propeller fold protein YncE